MNRYVAITPLYHGTTLDGLGTLIKDFETIAPAAAAPMESAVASGCGSCQEFLRGSPFLTHLYADGHYAVPGVTYTTIMTRYDDQCATDFSEHLTMAFDPVVAQDVLNALDPSDRQSVPCTLVLPGIGAPWFR